ncbi:MAG: DUF2939 domain-containing protein [Acetobacteraceae bacterium]|nr:DUF2939 domain-containing protein [Acetobacteraceae bacterium]
MRARWPVFAALLAVGATYVAYPYYTLYRLGEAIRHGDSVTLQAFVDWPSVREGIKEDICDLVLDDPADASRSAGLPPFGASFVRGITSNSIDRAVTPEALVAAVSTPAQRPAVDAGADVHVDWAFFDDLTDFTVSLKAPGQANPIRLQMQLRDAQWRVRRVWLPADLLQASAKT